MFEFLKKRKWKVAIKRYVLELSPALSARYGMSDQYTVHQIVKTIQNSDLPEKYIPYAIALFRHEESVNTTDLYRLDQEFLDMLRTELSLHIYGEDRYFDGKDILKISKIKRWRGGRHNGWMANSTGRTGY